MELMMDKIPIQIVEITSPSGTRAIEVMLDVLDYHKTDDVQQKLQLFKKKYFETVAKSKKILPTNKSQRKASHFWKIGKLLYDFNRSIGNEFEIKNYTLSIIRDFGLYERRHISHILQFGELFNKKDIDDSISMSTYLELIWKANFLKKVGMLEKEKKRLLKMSKENALPAQKYYRQDLNNLINSLKKV